ncbi:MAG: AbrB/MazE/SpoVT family DNA-binding domain-containing protein [Gammaproteobacteria bacterium]
MMRVKAQRWGNSIAVRIPKAVAEAASVKEQDEMDIEVRDGVIQLRPRAPEPSLDELLAGITPENLHSEMDFGRPEGREAW